MDKEGQFVPSFLSSFKLSLLFSIYIFKKSPTIQACLSDGVLYHHMEILCIPI